MANNTDGGIVLSVNIDSSEVSSDMKKVVKEINKQVQAEAKNIKAIESINQAKEKTAQLQQKTEKAVYNSLEAESKALTAENNLKIAKEKSATAEAKKETAIWDSLKAEQSAVREEQKLQTDKAKTAQLQQKVEQEVYKTLESENKALTAEERLKSAKQQTVIATEKAETAIWNSLEAEQKAVTQEQKLQTEKTKTAIAQQKLSQEIEKGYQAEEKTSQAELKTQQEKQKILLSEEKIKQAKEKTKQAEEKTRQAQEKTTREINKTEKAQNSLKKATSSVTQALKQMATTLGVAFGVSEILRFSNEASKLASQTEASVKRLGTLYGEYGQEVYDWANDNANALGMSKTAAYQAAAAYGNIFSTFASAEESADLTKDVLQATAVIASQTGRTYEETFEKIQSGLYGNTRAIDDLGISVRQSSLMQTEAYKKISQNGTKSWNELTDAELQQVRALAIVEQSTAKYGNNVLQSTALARSRFNSAWEDFKSTFGQAVNLVLIPILQVLTKIINAVTTALQGVLKFFGKELSVGSDSMQNVGDNASNISDNIDDATDSQKDLNKEVKKTLAGFDEIQTLQNDNNETEAITTPTTFDASAITTTNMKVVDSVDESTMYSWDRLLGVIEKIRDIFLSGFWKGFKNTDFSNVRKSIESIGKSVRNIFSNEDLQLSAQGLSETFIEVFGQLAGSVTSIGKTIAENLLGGLSGYLENNSTFIQDRLVGIFNISDEVLQLFGTLCEDIADIFDVFTSESGVNITENLIGIFSNAGLGIAELGLAIGDDFMYLLTTSIDENKEELEETLNGILDLFDGVTDGLENFITNLVEKVVKLYEEHISPLFRAISQTISNLIGTLLEKWNLYINPLLKRIGDDFRRLVEENINPMVNQIVKFVEKISDIVKKLWEKVLAPIVEWIWNVLVVTVIKVVKNITEDVWSCVKIVTKFISNLINDIFGFLNGVIDFFVGIFTGDFKSALNGLANAGKSVINSIIGVVELAINSVIAALNMFISGLDVVVGAAGSLIGKDWYVPKISYLSIPRLAQGAVIPANHEFLAILGDQKHGTNIETPVSTMKEAFRDVLNERGNFSQSSDKIVIQAILDGDVVFEKMIEKNRAYKNAMGVNAFGV